MTTAKTKTDKAKGVLKGRKPKTRAITASEAGKIEKNLKAAIISCTDIIDNKTIDATQKKPIGKIRKLLITANNYFGWNVQISIARKRTK